MWRGSAAGHGGQTLICRVTQELVRDQLSAGVSLRDLGEHYLRDLSQPEQIFQLVGDGMLCDFAPLKTLTNQTEAHISRQHKLPGMPEIDFDAILKKKHARQLKNRKGKGKPGGRAVLDLALQSDMPPCIRVNAALAPPCDQCIASLMINNSTSPGGGLVYNSAPCSCCC